MVEGFEKTIKFVRIRANNKVEQEENDVMERKDSIADEIILCMFEKDKNFSESMLMTGPAAPRDEKVNP